MTGCRSLFSRSTGHSLALLTGLILVYAIAGGERSTLRADEPAATELFEKEVRPLLIERCQPCHNAEKSKNGLRLIDRESILRGGDSGPAVVPGKPEDEFAHPRRARISKSPRCRPRNGSLMPTSRSLNVGWRWASRGLRWQKWKRHAGGHLASDRSATSLVGVPARARRAAPASQERF